MQKYQLLPLLTEEEYNALKADIAERGVLVSVEYDENGNILDGYHRVKACEELGIKEWPRIVRIGLTEAEKVEHVLKLNVHRRHLPKEWKQQKALELRQQGWSTRRIAAVLGIDQKTVVNWLEISGEEFSSPDFSSNSSPVPETITGRDGKLYPAKKRRRHIYISEGDARKAQKLPEELGKAVLSGQKKLKDAEREARIQRIIEKREAQVTSGDTRYRLIHGDIKDLVPFHVRGGEAYCEHCCMVHGSWSVSAEGEPGFYICNKCGHATKLDSDLVCTIEPGSVDVIITDPPYSREFLPLYKTLAKLAAWVLKPSGSLLVMTGQSYLPEVLAAMAPYINYHWVLAYLTPGGQSAQLWQRKVNTFWKPVLWFVNGRYEGKWIGDVAKSAVNDNDKRFHAWGQSESGMAELVERFSNPGDIVLDPFLGGGTTGVVAVKMERRFIGIDVDPAAITTADARITGVSANA